MKETRARIELVLRGWCTEAGIETGVVRQDRIVDLADALRESVGCKWFPDPAVLADALGLRLIVARHSNGPDYCSSPHMVVVAECHNEQERALLILLGVAHHWLAEKHGKHGEADAIFLAAELACPSPLLIRRGVGATVRANAYVPEWFLNAWERFLLGAPISRSAGT
ncbi:hypothetical protein [Sorangium sp. So ce388]|uniref:hypothetical protein n=1 Tax=Sorangium sp. So ce388 TaxID=3133309 RepID=UPI003F5B268C